MVRVIAWGKQGIGLDCFVSILRLQEGVEVVASGEDFDLIVGMASKSRPDAVVVIDDLGQDILREAPQSVRAVWPDAVPIAAVHRLTGFTSSIIEQANFAGVVHLVETGQRIVQIILDSFHRCGIQVLGAVDEAKSDIDDQSMPRGNGSKLTVRERTVLKHLALGLSSRDTARILGLNSRTVDAHRRRLSTKLDLSSVAELTKHCIAVGLIDLQSDETHVMGLERMEMAR